MSKFDPERLAESLAEDRGDNSSRVHATSLSAVTEVQLTVQRDGDGYYARVTRLGFCPAPYRSTQKGATVEEAIRLAVAEVGCTVETK